MADLIKQHSHCQICGKAIPVSEMYCSEECKQKYATMVRRRRIFVYLMYALIGIIIVILLFSSGF